MKVTDEHPFHKEWDNRLKMVKAAANGEPAVKALRELVLPRLNPDDKSKAANEFYDSYLARAVYANFTGKTQSELVGIAFKKKPVIDLPPSYEPYQLNIDGTKTSLISHMQQTLACMMAESLVALVVDYPEVEGAVSKKTLEEQNIRPTIKRYGFESIVDFHFESIGSEMVLQHIVLTEDYREKIGEFEYDEGTQYRQISIDDGVVQVSIWRKKSHESDYSRYKGPFPIKDAKGNNWTRIPVIMSDLMPPLLEDIALVNLGHFRNSAEYEELCLMAGYAQPTLSGVTKDWIKFLKDNDVRFGNRSFVPLPEGGKYEFAQADSNSIPKEAMEHKEAQLTALGSRAVADAVAAKTASEILDNKAQKASDLYTLCETVSRMYESCFELFNRFTGENSEPVIEINTDFESSMLDMVMLNSIVSIWEKGLIPDSDILDLLKRKELIDPTKPDKEVIQEIQDSVLRMSMPEMDLDEDKDDTEDA